MTRSGRIRRSPAEAARASSHNAEGYPEKICGWSRLSPSTISSRGLPIGNGWTDREGPVNERNMADDAWDGRPAATAAMATGSPGGRCRIQPRSSWRIRDTKLSAHPSQS